MENNPKEVNKYSDSTGNVKSLWGFKKSDLDSYLSNFKVILINQEDLGNSSGQVFLNELKLFISVVLQNSYTKNEASEIVDFFFSILENSIKWWTESTIEILGRECNFCTLQLLAKIIVMIIGVDENFSTFHKVHRKFTPKKLKKWEFLIKNSEICKLCMAFLHAFGTNQGFSVFFKVILSNASLELLLNFQMFELIKFQKKEYFDRWIVEFRNLLINKLLVDEMVGLNPAHFESSFKFYEKIDEIDCFKTSEELKFRYLAIAIKSGQLSTQKLALNKIKYLMNHEKIVTWVFENEIIPKILSQEDLEIFNMFKPILKKIGKDLDCYQINVIYKFIRSSNIGLPISEFLKSISLVLQKGVILAVFSLFSMQNSEEVLFATEFTQNVLEIFPFAYQDYNVQFFINLLHSENVTFNNFGIIILSTLYYRFALNPRVTSEIIDHIKNIEKDFYLIQNARLLIEIDKLNINFRFLISDKSAKSVVSSIVSEAVDKVYPKREKIQHLFKYLELYIKQSKALEKSMFTDIFNSLQSTENEDILSEWVNRCIVFCSPDITDEVFHCFFIDNPEYGRWTFYTFKCFMCMFLLLNSFERCIELKKGEMVVRLQRVLKYTDNLIEAGLFGNHEIFSESCKVLVNLHMNLGESLNKARKDIWDGFFYVLFKRSEENLNERILNVIYSFLKQPFGRVSGNLVLFLYKTCDESDYDEVYVEENSDVRMLKIKIGEKYGKDYWNISLRCDDSKNNRFQDDMKVKTLKSNLVIVEFENDNPDILNFGEYIAQSLEIQSYLMQTLSDEKDYSKLSLQILCLINFNTYFLYDLYQLTKSIDTIIPSSFYSFSFYTKLVEKIMIDQIWTEKFFVIGGVEYVLEIFNSTYTKDLQFNKCFLTISVYFTMKYPQLITRKLVKRTFFAYSVLVLSISDKDDPVFESLLQAKRLNIEIFEEILEDEAFFQEFWVNVVILSKNIIISVEIMKFFLEYSEKSEKCLRLTLMFVINTLSNPELNRKYQFEVYDFIKNLALLAENESFYIKLANKLNDSLSFNQKNLVTGLLYCLITEKFRFSTEFLVSVLQKILDPKSPFGFSKRIRRNLFELISVQFSFNTDLDKLRICEFFLSSNTELIKTDWNISPDAINLENFDYTKLVKQTSKIFLNSLMQQLYLQPQYKQTLKSLSDPGPLTSLLQKLFKRLEKYSKLLFNPKSLYDEIDKLNISSLETPANICIYTKAFIKHLNKEHKSIESTFPMQGVLSFDNQITKGCDHIMKKDSKNFLYLSLALKYKNIQSGINKIFMSENKKIKCKECGNFNYLQSKKLIMKYPEVLVVLLERFSSFEYSKNVPTCNRYYCEFETELNLKNYQHVDSDEKNTKYELTGIVSYNSALNCFISYCKVSGTWVKFKDDSVKLIKNQSFFRDLFGVANDADIKSKINTACVLVFNKCLNNRRTASLVSEGFGSQLYFYRNFLVSAEFLGFVNEIVVRKSSELLRFCFKYFFRFVVRISHVGILMGISKDVCLVLRADMKNSELFMEVIKDEEFVDMLLDCEDLFKSQLIGDLIFVALQNSRPSAYMRLFGFFLNCVRCARTYKSEVFFEIIYNICKLNPSLAIEEGANSKLFSLISHYKSLEDIPAFLLASYSLFYPYTSKHQLEILSDPVLINLALKSNHNHLTASELGKMIGKINDAKSIISYLAQQLESFKSENIQQKNLIIGILSVLESPESLQKTINLLMKTLKNKKKYESVCFQSIIEVIFLALLKNPNFFKSVKEHPKFIKEISKALSSHKQPDRLSIIPSEKMQEILKVLKKKSNLPAQLTEHLHLNAATKPINPSEVILEINNTTYYRTGQKFKFHNSLTGKFT